MRSGSRTEAVLVFPAVVIVRKLPKTMMARYMERSKPRRIELSLPLLDYSKNIHQQIILHEIGHWWRGEHVPFEEMSLWTKDLPKVTREIEEKFAHDFSDYFFTPNDMRATKPQRFKLIHNWIAPHKRTILTFAKSCYAKLEAAAKDRSLVKDSKI